VLFSSVKGIVAAVAVAVAVLAAAVLAVTGGDAAPHRARVAAATAGPVQVISSVSLRAAVPRRAQRMNAGGSASELHLPRSPWAASFDVRLAAHSVLKVGVGSALADRVVLRRGETSVIGATAGARTRRLGGVGWGPPGWHHVEISSGAATYVSLDGGTFRVARARGSTLSFAVSRGHATVSALMISPTSDRAWLLLDRLAELHARLLPREFPMVANRGDVLNLSFSWTNGFWAGALWQAAALAPGRNLFTSWALTATLQHLGYETTPTHDVGFMYGESSLAAWQALCRGSAPPAALCSRLRQSVLLAAGELVRLATTNPGAGTIPTSATSPYGETIIDSMMNIAILPWATQQTGSGTYARLAVHQANVIARLLVRPDGSTAQAVHFDRATGRIVFIGTHQGRSNTSTWSRGEAWALYGFSQLAAELRSRGDLRIALRVAGYVERHLPAGGIPRWDYDTGAGAPVDVSAGVITAAGLYHLAATCRILPGVCAHANRWPRLAGRMLTAALGRVSVRPPIGYLGSQITDERLRRCACNGGELIYGLTYALEALRLSLA
jgi:hypothetical protein